MKKKKNYGKVYGIKSNEEERFWKIRCNELYGLLSPWYQHCISNKQTNRQTFSQFIFERCPTKPEWIQLPIMESHLLGTKAKHRKHDKVEEDIVHQKKNTFKSKYRFGKSVKPDNFASFFLFVIWIVIPYVSKAIAIEHDIKPHDIYIIKEFVCFSNQMIYLDN